MRHIALLGGTFDPVHNGHLAIAAEARKAGFTDVFLIPNSVPPHKQSTRTAAAHRLAMTKCAVNEAEGIYVCDLELRRETPSYTADTLRILREQYGQDTGITWIMGDDAWNGIHTWYEAETIIETANLLVVHRRQENHAPEPDFQQNWLKTRNTRLADLLKSPYGCISKQIWPLPDVSSTEIRHVLSEYRAENRSEIAGRLLPAPVMQYIENNRLYPSENR